MKNWKLVGGSLAVMVAVFGVSYFCAMIGGKGDYDRSIMASWLQAIGSIAAIVGALWVAERQAKGAIESIKMQVARAAQDRRDSAVAIADAAWERAEMIRSTMSIADVNAVRVELYKTYDRSIIDGLVRALQGIPMHEIGSSKGVSELLLLIDQFTFLARSIQVFFDGPMRDPEVGPNIEQYLNGSAEDRKIGHDMHAQVVEVYRGNVYQHLNAIREHYNCFSDALSKLV
ncbi:hypothetical protein NX871_12975 [Burkholderia thailandensis]|uniref:hypothetical protein n=1 Tax=pseudomallei group TaxID=111527 RepID=UPI00050DC700|nr:MULTISPECIES: hypothetical protein [pseudomallei group]APZ02709.1 hypothetical protein BGI49_27610 [Burkholderia pseudomallei]APZ16291.1 hypothetical protein BGI52_27725 [Burkholderia pseudomallei]KGC46059.1 hypothetical protein DO66_2327 [Burkholderia pseudomallei]KGD55963.1 hypothetical protein DP49_2318 [Burkholderia pseudomallei]KGW25080.1 hypothetical protein Y047_4983 [Burkholderia pseudomallei MSHR3016]